MESSGSRAQARDLRCTVFVALWLVESSRTRDHPHVPGTGRWILHHQGSLQVQVLIFKVVTVRHPVSPQQDASGFELPPDFGSQHPGVR